MVKKLDIALERAKLDTILLVQMILAQKNNGGKVSYIVNLKNKYEVETWEISLKALFCLLEKEFPYESVYHDGAVRDSKFDTDYESDDEKKGATSTPNL